MKATAAEDLAVASFALGRLEAADRYWRTSLESSNPETQIDAEVLAMSTFGFDAELGPVARTSEEFASRFSPGEAAVRARRAAEAGERKEAAEHLARYRRMLEDGAHAPEPETALELARCYATLKQEAPAAEIWRAYLAGLDVAKLTLATHLADSYLGEMAHTPKVAAVTQEFNSPR